MAKKGTKFSDTTAATIEECLDLVLVLPDPGRALVLLGLDGGIVDIVGDVGIVIAG